MTQYLRVRNWDKFQHYKDRNPPWIKFHRELLHDYDFTCLQDASKLQLMLIWLLASQMDNKIPANPDWIKSQLNIKGKVCFKELIEKGFLEDESGTLAGRKQVAKPETEAETYNKEAEEEAERERVRACNEFWEAYPFKRGSKQDAMKLLIELLRKGEDYGQIIRGVKAYRAKCDAEGTLPKYVAHATTWIREQRWTWEYPIEPVREIRGTQPRGKGDIAREHSARAVEELKRERSIF